MLSEILKSRFTSRAKEVAKKVLDELNISKITEDNMYDFQLTLDSLVSGLVTEDEVEKKPIDRELLEIYDLLTDIVIDNDDDLPLLNELFLG